MSTEQSAASLQSFFQASQALTQTYFDFVTRQPSAFALPADPLWQSMTQLPSLEPFATLQRLSLIHI